MSLRNTIRNFKRPDPVKVKTSVFGLLVNTSSIHGVKYIGDLHSPRTARTFWIVAFLLSILGCFYYATQVYDKWYVTPDIGLKVQFNSSRTVPFPAITICPQTKIKKSFLNYSDILIPLISNMDIDVDPESKKYFEMAIQTCTTDHASMINRTIYGTDELDGSDIVKYMSRSQFALNETIIGLKHNNIFYNETFSRFMDRVITSDGFCATYNLQDYSTLFKEDSDLSEDFDSYKNNRTSTWNPLDGYANELTEQFPKRIFSGKKATTVFLMIQNSHDVDPACLGADQGYRIYWHMPNEIPSFLHRSVTVGLEQSKYLIMKATQVRTSDDLRRYHESQRRCFFEGEKYLRYFKSYTKTHCDLECLSNHTLKLCGCVKFFMPRTPDIPVCDLSKLECAENASISWLEQDKSYLNNLMPCNCYPSCANIKYDVALNIDTPFPSAATVAAFKEDQDFAEKFPTGQISRLTIEFEEFLIEAQENYLGYKIQHFISDCGGLLGLFMGCSILSLVEIFYQLFVTIFAPNANEVGESGDNKEEAPVKDAHPIVLIEEGKEEGKND